MVNVNSIPKDHEYITPHLLVKNSVSAIEFYKKVFGAVEEYRHMIPNKTGEEKTVHAVIRIGNSKLMLADEFPEMCSNTLSAGEKIGTPQTVGGNSVFLNLYFENVDKIFKKAQEAGATVIMPLADAFWGDRYGQFKDPHGHVWEMATHKKDMSHEELERAAEEAFKNMGKKV
jgi:PhnB protein